MIVNNVIMEKKCRSTVRHPQPTIKDVDVRYIENPLCSECSAQLIADPNINVVILYANTGMRYGHWRIHIA